MFAMLSFGMTPALADAAEAEYAAEKDRAATLLAAEFRALDQAVVRGNGASFRSVQLEKLPEPSGGPQSNLFVSDDEERLFLERSAEEFKRLDEEGEIRLGDGSVEFIDLEELIDQMEVAESLVEDIPQVNASRPEPSSQGSNAGHRMASFPPGFETNASNVRAVKWNWNSFGRCTAKKLGIKAAQEVIKVFAEPRVRKALKSKRYKKASSIAFRILKKTSPKLASFIIKRAANSVLPGGIVTFFAIPIGQCAIKELSSKG